MVRIRTEGIDEMINLLIRLGEGVGETADEMLQAGAGELKKGWEQSITQHNHIDTGDMINSVSSARTLRTLKDVRLIDVYPQGKDRKGTRNAEKAFILHYGAPQRGIKASHFVDEAASIAEPHVEEAMGKVFDDYLERNDKHG